MGIQRGLGKAGQSARFSRLRSRVEVAGALRPLSHSRCLHGGCLQ